jgi:hypothetical protein
VTNLDALIRCRQWTEIAGQFDADNLASWDRYARQVACSAGPWWPLLDAVMLSERPGAAHRDGQGRLHDATGPAVGFRDGWGRYYWHGRKVPPDLVEGGWTLERILAEPDIETPPVRRRACHRPLEADPETAVPPAGVPVLHEVADGNTPLLLAAGTVLFCPREQTPKKLTVGNFIVTDGAEAYLDHPEHGNSGIAPGRHLLRRMRESADELRLVVH